MTKDDYKDHLTDVVKAVFAAELSVNDTDPDLKEKLRSRKISADDYCSLVAEEIISRMTDADFKSIINQ